MVGVGNQQTPLMLVRDIFPDEIVDEDFIWRYGLADDLIFFLTTVTFVLSIFIVLKASTSGKYETLSLIKT
jgi:hypothetical protein